MNGEYLADRLRATARARGVSVNVFVVPLTRNPAGFLQTLSCAASPRPHTIARIEALIAGEPLPELERTIVISVPHSTWCKLDAEARRTRQKIAKTVAAMVVDAVGGL